MSDLGRRRPLRRIPTRMSPWSDVTALKGPSRAVRAERHQVHLGTVETIKEVPALFDAFVSGYEDPQSSRMADALSVVPTDAAVNPASPTQLVDAARQRPGVGDTCLRLFDLRGKVTDRVRQSATLHMHILTARTRNPCTHASQDRVAPTCIY